ncbi:MAG: gluconate 2-dehydrogenase subunit 3 family protein [Chitinophagaceae bacterium]|nr:gluconate 2-dehydrogenase subunit 3 family protein [Chitinophagaceae bacterium]
MNRRTYLELMMKTGLLASLPFANALKSYGAGIAEGLPEVFFSEEDFAFLAMISETILPKTDTIGAIEAGVPHFIDLYVKNCYTELRQNNYLDQLRKYREYLNAKSINLLKVNEDLTNQLIADELCDTADKRAYCDFIRQTKLMALKGYFTNQKAVMQNLYYKAVPGTYNGCIELSTIGKSWIN